MGSLAANPGALGAVVAFEQTDVAVEDEQEMGADEGANDCLSVYV